jgi:hypothetical protein
MSPTDSIGNYIKREEPAADYNNSVLKIGEQPDSLKTGGGATSGAPLGHDVPETRAISGGQAAPFPLETNAPPPPIIDQGQGQVAA